MEHFTNHQPSRFEPQTPHKLPLGPDLAEARLCEVVLATRDLLDVAEDVL